MTKRWSRRPVGRFLVSVRHDLWNLPRYLARYVVLLLALCGLLSFWDVYGDGPVPMLLPLRDIDPLRHSAAGCSGRQVSDAARWCGMTPALAILDEVNPTAAVWVRRLKADGVLVFSDRYSGEQEGREAVAMYDHLQHKLIVYEALFAENDGTIAAILCHEFRHSRQNSAKFARYVLSFVRAAHGDASIIENDAELYEREAQLAIFGR